MSLLVDMSAAALDPAYAEVAARGRGARPSYGRLLVLLVVVGLGTGIAAAQVRRHEAQLNDARHQLLADVRALTRTTDTLEAEAARRRSEVSRTRALVLSADAQGRAAADTVAALELSTGAVAVQGPGIEVRMSDAATTSRTGQGDGRLYDRDLQDVANALWLAGAEAVAINGQRLTAQTAIRSAGDAILVDLRPLTPPYVLQAIGNVDAMEPAFVDGPTARKFQTWTSLYGIGFQVRRASALSLPAAGAPDLRVARIGGEP